MRLWSQQGPGRTWYLKKVGPGASYLLSSAMCLLDCKAWVPYFTRASVTGPEVELSVCSVSWNAATHAETCWSPLRTERMASNL